MKKHFFILFLSTLLLSVSAQTTGSVGYWDLQGNTGTNNRMNFIGTTDNQPIIFKTFTTERMRLLSNKSFLGIGIPTPLAALHLHYQSDMNNDPPFPQLLQLTTPTCTTGFSIIYNRDTKDLYFRQQESAKFFLEGPGGGLVVAQDGNVGLGTDAPKQKLHIDEGNLLITSVNSGNYAPNGALIFSDVISSVYSHGKWSIEYLNSSNPTYGGQGLNFRKLHPIFSASLINSVLFLADDGNVGFGTKEPKHKLHIDGGNLLITGVNSGNYYPNSALIFADTINSLYPYGKWNIEYLNSTDSAYGNYGLNFRRHDGLATTPSASNVLFLSDIGGVAIGHKNPQAGLDVLGSFKASSATITEKLGIGVSNPLTNMQIGNLWTFQGGTSHNNMGRNTYNNGTKDVRIATGSASRISFNSSGEILLQTIESDTAGSIINRWNTVTIANNGRVGIGTTTAPKVELDVNGTFMATNATIADRITANDMRINNLLCAKEIKVQLANCWPDYVFSKDYNLLPLQELEQFVNKNQHLPNVPTATSVAENGVNVGEMNAILLQKMEEMTLYIIALQKQIDELKSSKP